MQPNDQILFAEPNHKFFFWGGRVREFGDKEQIWGDYLRYYPHRKTITAINGVC